MSWSHPIWPRFLSSSTVMACATVGPLGRMRRAPGTWGAAGGLVYQLLCFQQLEGHLLGTFMLSTVGIWFAVGICGEAEFRLGRRDPGEVVLDEFVAMPLCFLGWPFMQVGHIWPLAIFLTGFLLFRLFDILKPFGINRLQELPGGWGIVVDDLAAALLSCAVMQGAAALWRHYNPGS